MKILKIKEHLSSQELKEKCDKSTSIAEYKRWQCLYLLSIYDVDAAFLSAMTQQSKPTIYKIIQGYNKEGQGQVKPKAKGGRKHSLLSVGEEQEMMHSLTDKASKGIILQAKDIRKQVEKRVGKAVSDDYLWDLFKRNGWTKQTPRPEHPKKDIVAQNEFKKNSKTIWMPLRRSSTERYPTVH